MILTVDEAHTKVIQAVVALEDSIIDGKPYLNRQKEDEELLNSLKQYAEAVRAQAHKDFLLEM